MPLLIPRVRYGNPEVRGERGQAVCRGPSAHRLVHPNRQTEMRCCIAIYCEYCCCIAIYREYCCCIAIFCVYSCSRRAGPTRMSRASPPLAGMPSTRTPPFIGDNPGENLKSISHRCYLRQVAFEWELTRKTIYLPLNCL